ncbi:hypothetical protein [Sporomusa acidovorans]|uniref:hypothetical protein n=2 Tax=Sporomusa acidovorans TaxID=112900 RepID=UPI0035A0CE5D
MHEGRTALQTVREGLAMENNHLDFERMEEICKDFECMLDFIEQYMAEMNNEISKADLGKNDVLHDIELSRFNAFEGYRMAKDLQRILAVRRFWKDQQDVLRCFQNFCDQHKGLSAAIAKLLRNVNQKNKNAEKGIIRLEFGMI